MLSNRDDNTDRNDDSDGNADGNNAAGSGGGCRLPLAMTPQIEELIHGQQARQGRQRQ